MKTVQSVAALVASLLLSCGPQDPKVGRLPSGEKPTPPTFEPNARVLALTGDKTQHVDKFEGSFIFYHPDATVEGMEEAIAMSGRIKTAKFKTALFYAQNKPVYEKNRARIDAVDQFSLGEEKLSSAKALIDGFIGSKVLRKPEGKASFCDRTIWLAAISYLSRNMPLSEAPMMVSQCRDYYVEQGYLAAEEDPNCAAAPNGKNYMKCLWGPTGVQKTTSYRPDLTGGDESVVPATWAEMRELALSGNEAFFQGLAENGTFVRPDPDGILDEELQIFPGGGVMLFSESVYRNHKQQLTELFEAGVEWSVYEHLFVFPTSPAAKPPYRMTENGVKARFEIAAADRGILASVLGADDLVASAEEIQEQGELRQANKDIRDQLGFLNGTEGPHVYVNERRKAADALYKEGIAVTALAGTFLDVTYDKSIVEFKLGFVKDAPDMKVCFDAESNKVVSCPGSTPDKAPKNPFEFSWDQATGKISYKINVGDPSLLQLDLRKPYQSDDTDNSFQLIDPEKIKGRILDIELYPRSIKGVLDQITGSVQIKSQAGEVEYEGTMTLFRSTYSL